MYDEDEYTPTWFSVYFTSTDHVWLWNINYGVLMILDKEQITKNILEHDQKCL